MTGTQGYTSAVMGSTQGVLTQGLGTNTQQQMFTEDKGSDYGGECVTQTLIQTPRPTLYLM